MEDDLNAGTNICLIMINLLQRRPTGCGSEAQRTVGLLKSLGVPKQMLYVGGSRQNGSFWNRHINHLQVLERARMLYRTQIFNTHPDRAGGSLEQTIQLNRMWSRIQRSFRSHGHQLG